MNLLPGVYTAKKKNGDIYFRSNITYRMKHISLGSYATEEAAHKAYLTAHRILEDPTVSPEELLNTPERFSDLLFEKQICLVNFRDHNLYWGHINGSTEKVTRTGNPEDEFLLPQNPFKNAGASTRYRFDGWKAKERSYDFDYETFIDKKKQVATFPEGDITYVATWTIVQ